MTFHSILFDRAVTSAEKETPEEPVFFADLNLDQIIEAITAGKREYNLKPFFYAPLRQAETILYRHEVMRDMEDDSLLQIIRSFATKMIFVRRYLAMIETLEFKYHKEGWFLEAAVIYCEAVAGLAHDLNQTGLTAPGLLAFREYLTHYIASEYFTRLQKDASQLKAALSSAQYCLIIKGDLVKVRPYESEIDYSADVQAIFEKFKQSGVKDYRIKLPFVSGMNHVESQILDFVARLHPEIFATLEHFCARYGDPNGNFVDETIRVFDREIEFYVAFLEHAATIKQMGLKFCYPQITTTAKDIYTYAGFDLALAYKRWMENLPVVCNDFTLTGPERILIVSGPNQGGKTTFARTFGQLHYLASLGCPVPGREARLFLFDKLLTQFEKEEDIRNLRGKLQDDLVRVYAILEQATPDSIVILNEIFNSTTLQDAVFLSKKIMERIIQLDLLCVCVTFLDELASLSEKTVSMVSTIVPENPALRTYKLIRKPADGLAYAISIAEKHRLTYACVKERIQP